MAGSYDSRPRVLRLRGWWSVPALRYTERGSNLRGMRPFCRHHLEGLRCLCRVPERTRGLRAGMSSLTKNQQEIVDRIKAGWELGSTGGMGSSWWMQETGLGKGGRSIELNARTCQSLIDKKVIKQAGRGPGLSTKWELVTR